MDKTLSKFSLGDKVRVVGYDSENFSRSGELLDGREGTVVSLGSGKLYYWVSIPDPDILGVRLMTESELEPVEETLENEV